MTSLKITVTIIYGTYLRKNYLFILIYLTNHLFPNSCSHKVLCTDNIITNTYIHKILTMYFQAVMRHSNRSPIVRSHKQCPSYYIQPSKSINSTHIATLHHMRIWNWKAALISTQTLPVEDKCLATNPCAVANNDSFVASLEIESEQWPRYARYGVHRPFWHFGALFVVRWSLCVFGHVYRLGIYRSPRTLIYVGVVSGWSQRRVACHLFD